MKQHNAREMQRVKKKGKDWYIYFAAFFCAFCQPFLSFTTSYPRPYIYFSTFCLSDDGSCSEHTLAFVFHRGESVVFREFKTGDYKARFVGRGYGADG
jgi:hypothetical protein